MRIWTLCICSLQVLISCSDTSHASKQFSIDSLVYAHYEHQHDQLMSRNLFDVKSAARRATHFKQTWMKQIVDTLLYFERHRHRLRFQAAHSAELDGLFQRFKRSIKWVLPRHYSDSLFYDQYNFLERKFQEQYLAILNLEKNIDYANATFANQQLVFALAITSYMEVVKNAKATICGYGPPVYLKVFGPAGRDSLWVGAVQREHYPIDAIKIFVGVKTEFDLYETMFIRHIQKVAISDTAKDLILHYLDHGRITQWSSVGFINER